MKIKKQYLEGSETLEKLVDAIEVSRLLNLPLQSVWRLAREGKLPCYQFGGLYRFDPAEILKATRKLNGKN